MAQEASYECSNCPARAVYRHFAENSSLDPDQSGLILFNVARKFTQDGYKAGMATEQVLESMGNWAPDRQSTEPINGGLSQKDIAIMAMACGQKIALGKCKAEEQK